MSDCDGKWPLAYHVSFIDWDGKVLSLIDRDTVRKHLESYRRLGLRWVMTGAIQFVERATFDMAEGAAIFKEMLDEFGMRVTSNHGIMPSRAPLDGSQDEMREMMARCVETCAIIEPKAFVFHPGSVLGQVNYGANMFEAFEKEVAKFGMDRIIEVAADNIRFMGRLAREHNIAIAIENLGRFEPLGTLEQLPMLVQAVNEPNVGYCLDTGHAHAFGESVPDWIRSMGSKIFETHFHDNRALGVDMCRGQKWVLSSKQIDEHMPVGFGTISWLDVIAALDEVGFEGPVTFETGGWPADDAEEGFRLAIEWWRTCEKMAMEKKAH